jgi:predicted DNA-binding transcriptional regulator YafY
MTRTERLLHLLQILRRYRRPVSGAKLAAELGVSIRTLYRDIATLQMQGADIEGEPGIGYVLKPGYLLPPLMFSQDEMEALMLGIRWVSTFADHPLALAAIDAQAKIEEILPREIREGLGAVPLRVGPAGPAYLSTENLSDLRDAIRRERKLEICYLSEGGQESKRVIWPFAIGYFTHGRILVGWCETRNAYRHFRTDRLLSVRPLLARYPRRRGEMLREWLTQQSGEASASKKNGRSGRS